MKTIQTKETLPNNYFEKDFNEIMKGFSFRHSKPKINPTTGNYIQLSGYTTENLSPAFNSNSNNLKNK